MSTNTTTSGHDRRRSEQTKNAVSTKKPGATSLADDATTYHHDGCPVAGSEDRSTTEEASSIRRPLIAVSHDIEPSTMKRRHTTDMATRPHTPPDHTPRAAHRRDSVAASSSNSSTRERRQRPSRSRRSSTYSPSHSIGYGSSRPTSPCISTGRALPALNIEEAIALHRRSCSLFQNPAYITSSPDISPRPLLSASPNDDASSDAFIISQSTEEPSHARSEATDEPLPEPSPLLPPPTTTYWTSPHTRTTQYAEIDSWGRGVKGLWRKVAPKWFFRKAMLRFYEEGCSDAGSVRRYRIDVDDEKSGPASPAFAHEEQTRDVARKPSDVGIVALGLGGVRGGGGLGFKRPAFARAVSCF